MTQAINIIIGGKEYTDFTTASVSKSIETLAGTFTFNATSTSKIDFPIKVGSACQIVVQGEQVINGYVEKLSISYDANQHQIQVRGRDRTADIIDSTLGTAIKTEFKVPVTLKQITEQILKDLNLSDIKVIEQESLPAFTTGSVSADYGTTAFKFLQKYAHKRQVLLTTDGDGNIVFTRTPTLKYKTQLVLSENAASTILSGATSYDNSKRFHSYTCISHQKPNSSSSGTSTAYFIDSKDLTNSHGDTVDNDMRESRIYNFEANFTGDNATLKKRCLWEANFRKSQSSLWTYTVQGHMAAEDNFIWRAGYLVQVVDEFSDVNGLFLISSVTYTESLGEGTKTQLKLVTQEAFSLIVNTPEKNKKSTKAGIGQYWKKL